MLKAHIIFNFEETPYGGGNQFLKALRQEFLRCNCYADLARKADVVLFNSHHCLGRVRLAKMLYPRKIFIHRLDGIMTLTRNDINLDKKIHIFSQNIADGVIFQSEWAREKAKRFGYSHKAIDTVIKNAPDPEAFNNLGKEALHNPIRLIASSWSTNVNKGFEHLRWLDENLDFKRYAMTFVGNSRVLFRRINSISTKSPSELSQILKGHDIYIFSAREDACSNSLIEAMHCGLPVVYVNSGGNKEIAGSAGEPFHNNGDLLTAVDRVAANYKKYQEAIRLSGIKEIAALYLDFFNRIRQARNG